MSPTLFLFLFLITYEAVLNSLILVFAGHRFVGLQRRPQQLHFSFGRIRGQRAPRDLQHPQSVVERKLSLELQKQPTVAEEEVVGSSGHQVRVEFWIRVLQKQLQMLELDRHELPIRPEVSLQTFHDATEANEGMRLVVHYSKYR